MEDSAPKEDPPRASCNSSTDAMAVQDALIILAIRMMGGDIRQNPSARQHIIALARATPLFLTEDYARTRRRLDRFAGRAGTTDMDDLFACALDRLKGVHRAEALEWSANNAIIQHPSDEKSAMLYHIGKALGFSATEVAESLARAQPKPAGAAAADDH